MLDTTGGMGHTNFVLGANKMHQALISRHGRVSSPSRIGLDRPLSATVDEYTVDNSIGRIAEREPPSHPALKYGMGKSIDRDEELIEWPKKQYSGDGWNQFQFSGSGHQRQSPRALIDAYGSDKSMVTLNNMHDTSWQNTEEEEFNWEDMSPTLADHRRNNGFLPSSIILSRERLNGVVAANSAAMGQDNQSSRLHRAHLPPVDDSSVIAEDSFASSGVCFLNFSVIAIIFFL